MRTTLNRCTNCYDTYECFLSGHNLGDHTNGEWCPSCYAAVQEALRAIPKKVSRDRVATSSYTVQELLDIQKQRRDASRAKGQVMVERCFAPLFDLTGQDSHHSGEVRVDGVPLKYEYWEVAGMDKGVVSVEVARSTATGEIEGPWEMGAWSNFSTLTLCPEVDIHPAPFRDPNVQHGFEVKPLVMLHPSTFPLFEDKSIPMTRSYTASNRGSLITAPLPIGALPIYNEDEGA